MKENAKFRSDAGLKCFINRTTDGNCCKWCSSIAGRYVYGEEPQDVFRRHDNCGCSTIYENGRQRQDVWSKKSWEGPSLTRRDSAPAMLSTEQARQLQVRNLSYRGLTNGGGSGIIKIENFNPLSDSNVVPVLRRESQNWINTLTTEEIRAIKKYTKNSGDPADNKFYARLNAMLRGESAIDETLQYYSDLISNALHKNKLSHDIVCYRNMNMNVFTDFNVGDIFIPKQFLSASVTKSGALSGNYKMKIHVKKGAKGAYIESLSKYPRQREFLLDKNCAYRILAKSDNTIELEVIV